MIVLDANVLIGFLSSTDVHHLATRTFLKSTVTEVIACNVLTLAEALVHPTRADLHDAALASLHGIGLQVVPLSEDDALSLARIRSQYALRMPDAVALHTALSTRSSLATFDETLAAAAHRAGVHLAI